MYGVKPGSDNGGNCILCFLCTRSSFDPPQVDLRQFRMSGWGCSPRGVVETPAILVKALLQKGAASGASQRFNVSHYG